MNWKKYLTVLNNCKSPGEDLITNEMLNTLDRKQRKSGSKFSTTAGKEVQFLRYGKKQYDTDS